MEPSPQVKLYRLCSEIESFRFCGPTDDSDQQTAVVYGFKHLAKRFVATARRIKNHAIQDALKNISTNIDDLYGAFDLHSDLHPVIDLFREIAEQPENVVWVSSGETFVHASVIDALRQVKSKQFDLTKVIGFCEELNSAYALANYLSCSLLIRALLNHVPPAFGQANFQQVVSQSGRSLKELFKPLEDIARDVADLHTHSQIGRKESMPTKSQVEPFKPGFEFLLQELIKRVHEPS